MHSKIRLGLTGFITGLLSTIFYSSANIFHNGLQAPELSLGSYMPGALFGFTVGLLYVSYTRDITVRSCLKVIVSTVIGGLCFYGAYFITAFLAPKLTEMFPTPFYMPHLLGGLPIQSYIVTPATAMAAGFLSTLAFMWMWCLLTPQYFHKNLLRTSVFGGVIAALLIDILFVHGITILSSPFPIYLTDFIFFIGWQAVMIVIISRSLIKSHGRDAI